MKLKTTMILAAMTVANMTYAATITPDQALARVKSAQTCAPALMDIGDKKPALVHTAVTKTGTPAAYIMTNSGRKGYVVLSADDTAAPILGYADTGSFDPDNMPEAMAWWLEEYARQIEYANANGAPAYTAPMLRTAREAIAPMITTKWDQASPFYDKCPKAGAERTYTGCAATTLAQVANYWEYPAKGQGNIRYSCTSLGKTLSLNFDNITFDWDNMLDDYTKGYTEAQADAVSTLMRACGYAIKMEYSTSASSSLALNIADGMIKYLGYDPNAKYAIRALYSPSQWEELIYDNLKNVGPIPYGGTSMIGGGHSFICDGYDGNGYFHFNWGWSGMSDGYFRLDALTPASLGIGGGQGGGYNFSQDAVLGLQPPTGLPAESPILEVTQGGSLTGTVKSGKLTFGLEAEESACWLNYNAQTLDVTFGAKIERIKDGEAEFVTVAKIERDDPVTLKPGYGTASAFEAVVDLKALDLPDGKYKITLVTNIAQETRQEWIPVRPFYTYYNSINLTKLGSIMNVGKNTIDRVHIIDGGFNSELYYGGMAKVWAHVQNDTDSDLSKGFAPAIYVYDESIGQHQLYFLGSSTYVTVPAHSTKEIEWDTDLNLTVSGITGLNRDVTVKLTFFDESTYSFYENEIFKDVTMHPNPGLPSISMSGLTIEGAPTVIEEVETLGGAANVYLVSDRNNIPVAYTVRLTGAKPFCYRMLAVALSPEMSEEEGSEIVSYSGHPVFMEKLLSTYDFTTNLSVPTMQPGEYYVLTGAFIIDSSFSILGSNPQMLVFRLDDGTSSIGSVIGDSADTTIYNLQGIPMGQDWEALPAGLYIRGGKKMLKQ